METVRSDLKLELQAKDQQVKALEEGLKVMKERATTLPVESQSVATTDDVVPEPPSDDRSAKLLSK